MSKLYIPSKKEIRGPWLLDRKQLEELNEILEFAKENLEESQKKEIEEKLKKEIEKGDFKNVDEAVDYERSFFGNKVKINISLIDKDEKSLEGESLKDLLKDQHMSDFKPELLKAVIENGYSNKLELRVGKIYDGELSFNLKAYDNDIEDEIKYKIENWLDDYKPSRASQIWLQYGFLIFFISAIIFSLAVGSIYSIEEPSTTQIYQEEINTILKDGIDNQNRNEAINLILKQVSGYLPDGTKNREIISYTAIKISSIAFLLLLLALIKPKTTLGIGKNKLRMLTYRKYIQIVLITLPIIFIVTPLFETIKKLLGI